MIRAVSNNDISQICQIYNHYIKHTVITFEEQEVKPETIQSRISTVNQYNLPWIVYEQNGQVLGYAYATKWKERYSYRFSVEVTVYLAESAQGKGLGTKLYQTLLDELKQLNIHVAIGGITLPNPTSVALHEKLGMKKVAHFEQVGYKFDQWLDVGYWQITF